MRTQGTPSGFCNNEECNERALPGHLFCVAHQAQLVEQQKIAEPDIVDTSSPGVEPVSIPRPPKRTVRETRSEEATYDPLVEGSRLAQRMIMEEEEERIKFWKEQAERAPGQKLRPRLPTKLAMKRPRLDQTAIRDPETQENLVKPGRQGRWVREIDDQGNPCDHRIEEMRAYGYEVIRTGTGEPLRGIFGVAMQAPMEQYATRIAINLPVGALNRNALLSDADQVVKQTNSRAGEHVVGLVKEADHRRQRFEYGGEEKLIAEE